MLNFQISALVLIVIILAQKSDCQNNILKEHIKSLFSRSCGGNYNRLIHLCCDGNIITKDSKNDRCCGRTMVNQWQMCCDGVPQSNQGPNVKCCGQRTYDSSYELCCDYSSIHNKYSMADKCCGRQVYDSFRDKCHFGKVQYGKG